MNESIQNFIKIVNILMKQTLLESEHIPWFKTKGDSHAVQFVGPISLQ